MVVSIVRFNAYPRQLALEVKCNPVTQRCGLFKLTQPPALFRMWCLATALFPVLLLSGFHVYYKKP